MTDADYIDDPGLLTNTSAQAEFLQYSLKQITESIVLYVNTNKTEFMCFKQRAISTWQASEISRQVHIPLRKYLIYWKGYQHTPRESEDCYWKVIIYKDI